MAEPTLMDRTFGVAKKRMVETGQARRYTELAAELGLSPREGKAALRDACQG